MRPSSRREQVNAPRKINHKLFIKVCQIPPGVGLGGGVKLFIYVLEGGGGQPGNPSGYTLDTFQENNIRDLPRLSLGCLRVVT